MQIHQLESGICDERNWSYFQVMFRKFAYCLMRRVTSSHNSIVTTIVNTDKYQQSPLMHG